MNKNPLISALEKLSRKEMTRFREFSLSPYFNKHKDVQALINYLSHKYPDFTEKNCERKLIWKKLQIRNKFDYAHLSLVFTYSLRLLERFFAVEKMESNTADEQFFLAAYLRERHLFRQYEKNQKSIAKQLQKAQYRDADYYFDLYRFADECDQKYLKVTKNRADDGLQEKQDALDIWYMAMKLRDACEMHMRHRYFGEEYEARMLNEVLEEIREQESDYQSIPAVYIYFSAYQMLTKNSKQDYFRLKKKLEDTADLFPQEELQNIYNYLQNFCIGQINRGNSEFLQELFLIYRSQLTRELIFEKNGSLAEWHYKNIVTTGLRTQAFDWVFDFIEKYKSHLAPTVAENAYSFNLANYYFAIEKYREVLPLLIQVEYSDMRYKLDVRALLLRTYFHLNESDAFYALCDAFSQLLARQKEIPDSRHQGYQNMIKLSRKIYTLKSEKDYMSRVDFDKERKKLTIELNETKPTFNAGWLKLLMNEI